MRTLSKCQAVVIICTTLVLFVTCQVKRTPACSEYQCPDGTCVNGTLLCNGVANCDTDENSITCPASTCRTTGTCNGACLAGNCIVCDQDCDTITQCSATGLFRCDAQCTPKFFLNADNVCEQKMCDQDPCLNGATCDDSGANWFNPLTCICAPGYTGDLCESEINECDSNPCQNGATCQDLFLSYSCTCAMGWTEVNCETDIDECMSNPCANDGTCNNELGSFNCDCPDPWVGPTCEINSNDPTPCESNPCANGGTCTEPIQYVNYQCTCPAGITGFNCEFDPAACAPNPCFGGGTCQVVAYGFQCTCPTGFTGDTCQTNINECESSPCRNGGTCADLVAGYVCACPLDYNGDNCELLPGQGKCGRYKCQRGGTCLQLTSSRFKCICRRGRGAYYCQIACDPQCKSNSGCDIAGPGKCDYECAPGFRLISGTKTCRDIRCKTNRNFRRRHRSTCRWVKSKTNTWNRKLARKRGFGGFPAKYVGGR